MNKIKLRAEWQSATEEATSQTPRIADGAHLDTAPDLASIAERRSPIRRVSG